MEIIKPFALEQGNRIGIVAPSMYITDEKAVENGIETLQGLGFKVEIGPTVYSRYKNTTATPEKRAGEIMDFFEDDKIKAIICLIGGDTTSQVLKLLDYRKINTHPKIFSGMSDIGHLNLALLARSSLISLYGLDLIYGFGADGNDPVTKYNIDLFIKCCMRREPLGKIPAFTRWDCWRSGKATGRLIGGYLQAASDLFQTKYWPSLTDVIFFWETLETQPHEIERQLTIMEADGFFDNVKGMIIGKLVGCEEKDYIGLLPDLKEIVLDITKNYNFPIIADADFGHDITSMPMPEGLLAQIDAANLSIELIESMVC
jgi:muramoyltetrapeptide carboxypeptidase